MISIESNEPCNLILAQEATSGNGFARDIFGILARTSPGVGQKARTR
jgi:hypothetical protein